MTSEYASPPWFDAGGHEGARHKLLPGHISRITAFSLTRGGAQLVTAGMDQDLMFWDLNTGQPLRGIPFYSNDIFRIASSTNGRRLMVFSRFSNAYYDVDNNDCGYYIELSPYEATAIEISPNEASFVVADSGGHISVGSFSNTYLKLDPVTEQERLTLPYSEKFSFEIRTSIDEYDEMQYDNDVVNAVAISPVSEHVVTHDTGGKLRLWEPGLQHQIAQVDAPEHCFFASDGGSIIAAGSFSIEVFDQTLKKRLSRIETDVADARACALANTSRIVIGGRDGLSCWNIGSSKCEGKVRATSPVESVLYSEPTEQVLSLHQDGAVRVWPRIEQWQPTGS